MVMAASTLASRHRVHNAGGPEVHPESTSREERVREENYLQWFRVLSGLERVSTLNQFVQSVSSSSCFPYNLSSVRYVSNKNSVQFVCYLKRGIMIVFSSSPKKKLCLGACWDATTIVSLWINQLGMTFLFHWIITRMKSNISLRKDPWLEKRKWHWINFVSLSEWSPK